MLKRLVKWSVGLFCAVVLLIVVFVAFLIRSQSQASDQPNYFEEEILAFEKADAISFPESGQIVFVGSSSVRFWDSLVEGMKPLPIIQRGFGGAHMEHVLHNLDRVVLPYKPKVVVVFVGVNDIGSGKSPDHVGNNFRSFVERISASLPGTDIWLMSMKPSKARWDKWSQMRGVNEHLMQLARENEHVFFEDTGATLLNSEGTPDEVYIFDGLHLNEDGYARWINHLKPALLSRYPEFSL